MLRKDKKLKFSKGVMSTINHDVRIVVVGTKRSQILDLDEEFVAEFKKGDELREDLTGLSDLIENTANRSLYRGDWIRSLVVDGRDLVQDIIHNCLIENNFSVDETIPDLSKHPFFANADPADLFALVCQVASSNEPDDEDLNQTN